MSSSSSSSGAESCVQQQDLPKQIGCINGLFQLFDRRHLFTCRRPASQHNKTPVTEVGVQEKAIQNKATKPGLSVKTGDKEERICVLKHIDSPRPSQPWHDLRDVVKDSMYREAEEGGRVLHIMHHHATRDPCRLSYDGRESRETMKSTMKLGERPRLSLDSRVRSIQNLSEGNEDFGSHRRPSSVVAKLMGLEGFPESSIPTSFDNSVQISEKLGQQSKKPQEDSSSPCFKPTKPTSNSRLPLEPAPWRRQSPLKSKEASSVYSEVEKRMTEIELDKSGKDMRALKHILKAMQKTRLENQTQQDLLPHCDTDFQMNKSSPPPKRSLSSHSIKNSATVSDRISVSSSSTHYRGDSVNKERKSLTPKRSNIKDPSQSLPSIQKMNTRTSSPRVQKKKLVIEKQPRLSIPQSELSRVKRNQNKQLKESESPNRRQKPKPANQQHGCNHLSEMSSGRGNFCQHSDTASVQSESNNSWTSCMETEVTTTYHNIQMGGKQKVVHKETNEARLSGDTMMAEVAMPIAEQPSPVSVLDARFYIEDSPSPVKKKISIAFGEHDVTDADEAEWHTEELESLPFSTRNNIDHPLHKLMLLNSTPCEDSMNELAPFYQSDNSDHQYITKILMASGLLKDLDCVCTAALHPSGHLINPKLFHVLEQAEERTSPTCKRPQENSARIKFEQKIYRKIVFDTVNEILVHKLALEHTVMQERSLSGQKILKELYADIDHLRPESDCFLATQDDELVKIMKGDFKHELEDWIEHRGELPALALDIERLIFKDLLTEVIGGAVPWVQDRPRRHSKQLFTN